MTLPTFSFNPSACSAYTLTEAISYPAFVATPSTVFTYTSSSRSFGIYTTSTAAVGTYTVRLRASSSYDSTNYYDLTFSVEISICALTITKSAEPTNMAYKLLSLRPYHHSALHLLLAFIP